MNRITTWLLFGVLVAYTLWIGEYGYGGVPIVNRGITAILMASLIIHLYSSHPPRIRVHPVYLCPLAMCAYGLIQTTFSSQKIIYYGLDQSLYWYTVACIAYLAVHVLDERCAEQFRLGIALLGGCEAVLSLLQQAVQTDKYFGLFPSRTTHVYGTFGYANNFAQFIEMTLPVTLWQGIRKKEGQVPFLLLAALQVGAVVASGSRGGTLLVSVELFVIMIVGWLRHRENLSGAAVALTFSLAAGSVYLSGFDRVVNKFRRPDQFADRHLLNAASIEMIRARPISGWGLGTFPWIYKRFARYDDGTQIGRAHNDYLEWAAEGGIPYACIMFVLVGWTIWQAPRRVWAVGLVAINIHALADFPFARLGTAGWYFALTAMLFTSLAEQGNFSPENQIDVKHLSTIR